MKSIEYRGFVLKAGQSRGTWMVALHTRSRFGTLSEVKADVDSFIAGTLPDAKSRPW
jgi:hypothetical protein